MKPTAERRTHSSRTPGRLRSSARSMSSVWHQPAGRGSTCPSLPKCDDLGVVTTFESSETPTRRPPKQEQMDASPDIVRWSGASCACSCPSISRGWATSTRTPSKTTRVSPWSTRVSRARSRGRCSGAGWTRRESPWPGSIPSSSRIRIPTTLAGPGCWPRKAEAPLWPLTDSAPSSIRGHRRS